MSTVYMTEVEQLEVLKRWWKRYQQVILTGLTVVLLLVSGVRYWQWHQQKVTEQASNAYEHLMMAFSSQDAEAVSAYAQQLVTQYSGTIYADTAHLIRAKLALATGKYADAKQALQAVAVHSKFTILADVARLRLARVFMYEKAYDAALQQLELVKNINYVALRTELRGDIYFAMGKLKAAKHEYQVAQASIEKTGVNNLFLEMKQHDVLIAMHAATPVHTAHALS